MHAKERDFSLLMLHSKVRHVCSADGTQGLKAHKMALSFCSKFKDGSLKFRGRRKRVFSNPSTQLPQLRAALRVHTPLLTPHPRDVPSAVAPRWPRLLPSCPGCHAMLWLCLQASSPTLPHCHELHSSPPRSRRGWMVGENKFIYFCCKFFYTF